MSASCVENVNQSSLRTATTCCSPTPPSSGQLATLEDPPPVGAASWPPLRLCANDAALPPVDTAAASAGDGRSWTKRCWFASALRARSSKTWEFVTRACRCVCDRRVEAKGRDGGEGHSYHVHAIPLNTRIPGGNGCYRTASESVI